MTATPYFGLQNYFSVDEFAVKLFLNSITNFIPNPVIFL